MRHEKLMQYWALQYWKNRQFHFTRKRAKQLLRNGKKSSS